MAYPRVLKPKLPETITLKGVFPGLPEQELIMSLARDDGEKRYGTGFGGTTIGQMSARHLASWLRDRDMEPVITHGTNTLQITSSPRMAAMIQAVNDVLSGKAPTKPTDEDLQKTRVETIQEDGIVSVEVKPEDTQKLLELAL